MLVMIKIFSLNVVKFLVMIKVFKSLIEFFKIPNVTCGSHGAHCMWGGETVVLFPVLGGGAGGVTSATAGGGPVAQE